MNIHTRYKDEIYTPGDHSPGPPNIINFDEKIQAEYTGLLNKKRELDAMLRTGWNKQNAIVKEMGEAIAAGADWKPLAEELAELRLLETALEAGIAHLDGQAGLLKRVNHWLK